MIRKIKSGYKIISHKGKTLGKFRTRRAAVKRLRQIEWFKHKGRASA